jgi:endonuclease YncB( thermonuclease family)
MSETIYDKPPVPPQHNAFALQQRSIPIVLPPTGTAIVKSVSSGDTVTLIRSFSDQKSVLFSLSGVSAPRPANNIKGTNDEPGAFPARQFLRDLVVGKTVKFEVLNRGTDRFSGMLYTIDDNKNIAIECARAGHVNIRRDNRGGDDKNGNNDDNDIDEKAAAYKSDLEAALEVAKSNSANIFSENPIVRVLKNATEEFTIDDLVSSASGSTVKCSVE